MSGGQGVWRWGEREVIYLSIHCHHQNDSYIKTGSDGSHFNVSFIVGGGGEATQTYGEGAHSEHRFPAHSEHP